MFVRASAPTKTTATTAARLGQNDYRGQWAALSDLSDYSDDGILTPTQGSVLGAALHIDESAEVRDEDQHAAELDLVPRPICVRAMEYHEGHIAPPPTHGRRRIQNGLAVPQEGSHVDAQVPGLRSAN